MCSYERSEEREAVCDKCVQYQTLRERWREYEKAGQSYSWSGKHVKRLGLNTLANAVGLCNRNITSGKLLGDDSVRVSGTYRMCGSCQPL